MAKKLWTGAIVLYLLVLLIGCSDPPVDQQALTYPSDVGRLMALYERSSMDDTENLSQLLHALPFGDAIREITPQVEDRRVEISYNITATEADKRSVQSSMLYNAGALFMLIDDIDTVHYTFRGSTYTLPREYVQQWYGVTLATVETEDEFTKLLQIARDNPASAQDFMRARRN